VVVVVVLVVVVVVVVLVVVIDCCKFTYRKGHLRLSCCPSTPVLLLPHPQAAILLAALVSPNQEVAFVIAAGYASISIFSAGVFVSIPTMTESSPLYFLHYASSLKYLYQAAILLFFKGNPMTTTPLGGSVEEYLTMAGR